MKWENRHCRPRLLLLFLLLLFGSTNIGFPGTLEARAASKAGYLCDSSSLYSYDELQQDLTKLQKAYPSYVSVDSAGTTLDGRKLSVIHIGKESAEKKILIFGAIHAREYLTAQLVMKQATAFVGELAAKKNSYKGSSYEQLMNGVRVDVIPMINPDGVTISQFGIAGLLKQENHDRIYRIYEQDGAVEIDPYLRKWKSNAEGIDLNRNFDAKWELYQDNVGHPSSDHYKGTAVGTAKEAKALIDLTEKNHYSRTISYHAQGGVIYWYFGQSGTLLNQSKSFAQEIADTTGYTLDADYEKLDPAGYKDWALDKLGIPSITIEVGSGEVPLNPGQLGGIYERNKNVFAAALYTLK